jgi:SAM-dependent methyltransferase
MSKKDEKAYFRAIGSGGIDFTVRKPFSDTENVGALLSDIAAIFSVMPKAPALLLDLGCGSGWTSNFFALAGYQVLGIDISKEAIVAAKENFSDAKNLNFEQADYDNLKHEDKFDIAVFFDSLHHSDDQTLVLKAAYRALKPGGTIVLCEPGKGHSKSPTSIEAMKAYGVSERDMPPSLSKMSLKSAGFSNIKVYAYPALSHRVSYKNFKGIKGKLLNSGASRGLVLFGLSTVLRRDHGIVVALKSKD